MGDSDISGIATETAPGGPPEPPPVIDFATDPEVVRVAATYEEYQEN